MMRLIGFLTLLLGTCVTASAQEKDLQWFVNADINAYMPGKNSAKSVFPVLGYNKYTSPKLLLGGVGMGVYMWKPVAKNLNLKVYGNISKLTYWDDPVIITNAVGAYSGIHQGWSSDYMMGIGGIVHYNLASRLSAGAGLGAQALIISLSRMPEMYGYGLEVEPSIVVNRYYKTVLPIVPLEIGYKLQKMMVHLRYDIGLMNKLKGDLGKNKSEKFGVLILGVGFRIR